MSEKSIINVKSTEIAERAFNINHVVGSGRSLMLGEKDEEGKLRVLLDITAGSNYQIRIEATVSDEELI